jgi:cell division protein FtsB
MRTLEEQERAAYAAGDISTAGMLARVIELQDYVESLERENDELREEIKDLHQQIEDIKDAS